MSRIRRSGEPVPGSLAAASAALDAVDQTLRGAPGPPGPEPAGPSAGPDGRSPAEQALAALLLLREVRERLAGWECGLIEAAREEGASWAELAGPLGVASRQAAERRYLRLRPGPDGSTGEERVKATRDHRAADRSVSAWARDNAGDLRRLAGQITALTDLPGSADASLGDLSRALAADDAAGLVTPLADARPHLDADHPELAARIDGITTHTDRLRRDSDDRRSGQG
ncbi:type III effector protein [Streptomyces solincola]|uniref:Type III effector protein n=1 Tax=Streptomyces solincola TaxID=2100817 RepID=A0A2S9PV60_9ACTN|nr:type III effector protein [Streptomyces solincola]PRH78316.1 type III effector protein [Streptomyces solincola]